jgi:hypothetical protein
MRNLILAFDRWKVRSAGMITFRDDPDCLLRLEVQIAPRNLNYGRESIRKGEKILAFHIWNEHLPPPPQTGADPGWAFATYRLFDGSLKPMAEYIQNNIDPTGIKVIRGKTVLLPLSENTSRTPLQSLGFSIRPYTSPLGSFGNFWEHFYLYWLIWAFNPGSVRSRSLFDVSMTEIWMPLQDLLTRYGSK